LDLWYSRSESAGADFRIRVRKPLFSAESQEKRIDVFETEDFGRVLVLDGRVAVSELEGESCREMAVHVPLNVHRRAVSALVVGGGDGGVVSELVKHKGLERITVVEPDDGVIEAARRWFPALAQAFSDPRVRVEGGDAGSFVRETRDRFDVMVIDEADGDVAGDGPQAQTFYCDCFRILSGDGILVNRAGSATYPQRRRELSTRAGKLKRLFPVYRLFRAEEAAGCPGEVLLGFASKRYDPIRDLDADSWPSKGIETRYYSPSMHRAAFALPKAVEELLAGI
jgi:spermidine synthase